MFKRILTALSLMTMALTMFGSVSRAAQAQTEPSAIIDAAFNDLNAKLGTSLGRTKPSNSSYTWEQLNFGSPALGCPAPGVNYAQVVTSGYKIIITVNGTAYDYRASIDGKTLFQCSSAGVPVGSVGATAPATVTPGAVVPAGNQSKSYSNPVAYIGRDNNVYVTQIGGQGSTPITIDAKGKAAPYYPLFETLHFYSYLRWSPDGQNLAFVELASPGLLYVAHSGQAAKVVARGVEPSFPPFWLPGGQEIGFVVATGTGGDPGGVSALFQIQAISIAGGSPRVLGQFSHVAACGGGGFSPDEIGYYYESGYMGNALILSNTKSGGYLYSPACTGVGLGFTPGTAGGWQRPDLGRAVLSPDGTQLIAVRYDLSNKTAPSTPVGLEKVDIATGNSTPLATQPGVDQVAWADNNTILYSTLTAPKSLTIKVALNADQTAATGLIDPTSPVTSYTVTLWKMPAAGGGSVQLLSTTGRGIGAISVTADGTSVLYSVIPSMEAVVNAANSGQNAQTITQSLPFSTIGMVSINVQNAVSLLAGGRPTTAAGTFAAVSPGPAVANSPPTALVVGGQAVVTVTGDALNMRVSPTKGAQVLRLLKAGIPVTIVGGPTNADGLRWWQVKLADGTTGWVVDQITDSTGTTNTLTPQ
jgi:hypothetical protein